MKYIDKLISEYKEAIRNHYNSFSHETVSYFASKYFDYDEFLEEYLEITDLTDKFLYLKFLLYEVQKEYDSILSSLNESKRLLSLDWVNEKKHKDVKDVCTENIPRYEYYLPTLKEIFENLERELKECELLIKSEKGRNEFEKEDSKKPEKPIHITQINSSKIQWNDTEESLIRIFNYLCHSGFINKESYFKRFSLITKTFINKSGGEFKNKQLSVTSNGMNNKMSADITAHSKFSKLIELIQNDLK